MTTYSVHYMTLLGGNIVATGLGYAAAVSKIEECVTWHRNTFDEGEGQTITRENPSGKIPYRVTIKTSTAEAGMCLDQWSVIKEEAQD